jgi:hypothetical protein
MHTQSEASSAPADDEECAGHKYWVSKKQYVLGSQW